MAGRLVAFWLRRSENHHPFGQTWVSIFDGLAAQNPHHTSSAEAVPDAAHYRRGPFQVVEPRKPRGSG